MQNESRFTRRALCRAGLWLLVAAAFVAPSCKSAPAAPPAPVQPIHLVVLHTNDIHGQVLPRNSTPRGAGKTVSIGGLPRLAARIQSVRAGEANVIVVDAGDWSQGTPEGALEDGLGVLQAIAAIGYDALCIGNHDLDHGIAQLSERLSSTALPTVLANVRERGTNARVPWTRPWRIVKAGGLRIALVGLLTTATPEITHSDAHSLVFEEPGAALEEARRELAGQFDLLIPVAHLGVDEARKLAREHPELPLIVSGHSHDALPKGIREGNTLIVQTGSKAAALGRVDLWFEAGQVQRSTASLEELTSEPEAGARVAAVDLICDGLARRASEQLVQVVGTLASPARRHKELGSSSSGNWICDAMKDHAGAEIALHNKGGTRSDLAAGPVTRRDLYEFLPFDNELVELSLKGSELEACLRRAFENPAHKGLEFSGLRAFVRKEKDGAVKLMRLEVNGAELEAGREYRVVTNSFLATGGDGLVELKNAGQRRTDPLLQRELMEQLLSSGAACAPTEEQRVVVVDSVPAIPVEASSKQ